jgi:hypothetical protein
MKVLFSRWLCAVASVAAVVAAGAVDGVADAPSTPLLHNEDTAPFQLGRGGNKLNVHVVGHSHDDPGTVYHTTVLHSSVAYAHVFCWAVILFDVFCWWFIVFISTVSVFSNMKF